jgi:hypothetical protein
MPAQKRHISEQSVATPYAFLYAAARRLRIPRFHFDLAASADNARCGPHNYFDIKDNALSRSWEDPVNDRQCLADGWSHYGVVPWNWLNPPFADITPWVEKAYAESLLGAHTAVLVPSSTGANWWNDWVHGYAYVLAIRGRLQFEGHTDQYPKDLALLLYTPIGFTGYDLWPWKDDRQNERTPHD